MDWAQIIVVLLSIMLGILVVAAIGLIVSFLLLTHKIRQASSEVRSLTQNLARIVGVAKTVVFSARNIMSVLKAFKQKKGASSGRRDKDTKTGK